MISAETTIFTVMSQLAQQYSAINLAQGFPDFDIDPKLKEITAKLAYEGQHQYQPMMGHLGLREKISGLTQTNYHRTVNPNSEILITAGATQGIYTAIQALVSSGDEVIILDPSYDCYTTPIVLRGAKPVRIALNSEYLPDWMVISEAVSAKTRMIIINNPHNPSGRIWNISDFEALESILDKYPQILVLSDEVYEYVTFEQKHISVHQRSKLQEKSIVVSSFGKSLHITGWKIGYLIAPESLMNQIKKVHQYLVFCVNGLAQQAIDAYLSEDVTALVSAFYQTKRDYFRDLLLGSRFDLLPCEGSYFQLASYAHLSDANEIDFTLKLVQEYRIAVIPVCPFRQDEQDQKHIRFCFAKKNETLEQAAEILHKL
ncbi:MAG: aminotransferase class I/II-fold pyridoxal phosphate-dependent enzyme [Bacteroidetes bacterium]|nr:aminotransferase class I/II-fold pyridoxal phosphate-dependent enzyme [Bacteroidota bacterium]